MRISSVLFLFSIVSQEIHFVYGSSVNSSAVQHAKPTSKDAGYSSTDSAGSVTISNSMAETAKSGYPEDKSVEKKPKSKKKKKPKKKKSKKKLLDFLDFLDFFLDFLDKKSKKSPKKSSPTYKGSKSTVTSKKSPESKSVESSPKKDGNPKSAGPAYGGNSSSIGSSTKASNSSSSKSAYGGADSGSSIAPGKIIDLENWKITLPSGSPGKPESVKQPELNTFSQKDFFYVKDNSVIFTAPCSGYTTPNSKYPRSELREMTGGTEANWSAGSGTHTLIVDHAVLNLPVAKPEVSIAQIHDAKDDIVQILVVGKTVQAMIFGKRDPKYILDNNYVLGTKIKTKILVDKGVINIFYNDMDKPSIQESYTGDGNYFKVGAYTQSNPSKGDAPSAFSQVQVFSVSVSHS